MSKINFINLKLKSHEEYLIYRTYFIKQKTWFSSEIAKWEKANETIKCPVNQKLRLILQEYVHVWLLDTLE